MLIPRHNLYMVNIAWGDENTTTVYVLCVFSVLAEGKTLPKIIMGTDFSWLWISLTRRMNLFILTHVQLFSIILKSCEIQHYWFNAKNNLFQIERSRKFSPYLGIEDKLLLFAFLNLSSVKKKKSFNSTLCSEII